MKKMNLLMASLILVLITACGSSQKAEQVTPPPAPEMEIKLDYVLVDASEGDRPDWILNPVVADKGENRSKYRYFVSEANRSHKRLCLKSAQARANAKIAGEVTQFIKNTYSEATQGSDDDVTEYMQEQLTQEIQSFVVGAETVRTYWEKRRYKKDLGAYKNKDAYACYALVRIKKDNLSEMIKMAKKKLLKSIESPQVKMKTEKAIKDVEEKFNQLN